MEFFNFSSYENKFIFNRNFLESNFNTIHFLVTVIYLCIELFALFHVRLKWKRIMLDTDLKNRNFIFYRKLPAITGAMPELLDSW